MEMLKKLTNFKEEIEDQEKEKNRKEGKLDSLKNQLLDEFDCKNKERAIMNLDKLNSEITKDEKILSEGINELEEIFNGSPRI